MKAMPFRRAARSKLPAGIEAARRGAYPDDQEVVAPRGGPRTGTAVPPDRVRAGLT